MGIRYQDTYVILEEVSVELKEGGAERIETTLRGLDSHPVLDETSAREILAAPITIPPFLDKFFGSDNMRELMRLLKDPVVDEVNFLYTTGVM